MGYYIETDSNEEKAQWLKNNLGAINLTGRPTHVGDGYVPVCVVHSASFEAAGIAFSPKEAAAMDDKKDNRKREWLLIKIDDAVRLCPDVGPLINWRS